MGAARVVDRGDRLDLGERVAVTTRGGQRRSVLILRLRPGDPVDPRGALASAAAAGGAAPERAIAALRCARAVAFDVDSTVITTEGIDAKRRPSSSAKACTTRTAAAASAAMPTAVASPSFSAHPAQHEHIC